MPIENSMENLFIYHTSIHIFFSFAPLSHIVFHELLFAHPLVIPFPLLLPPPPLLYSLGKYHSKRALICYLFTLMHYIFYMDQNILNVMLNRSLLYFSPYNETSESVITQCTSRALQTVAVSSANSACKCIC
jgi:hypothetical protein